MTPESTEHPADIAIAIHHQDGHAGVRTVLRDAARQDRGHAAQSKLILEVDDEPNR